MDCQIKKVRSTCRTSFQTFSDVSSHDQQMAEAELRTPTGSDDEDVVDSKYWNAEVTGKRARKEVARLESAASPQQKRKSIAVNAAGTRLGDIKVIADRIQGTTVHKGNDDENPLKELHHVIFARAGKWNEVLQLPQRDPTQLFNPDS
jgi:hypothetical protein